MLNSDDPSNQADPIETSEASDRPDLPTEDQSDKPRRSFLIGSQRDPAAYLARRTRDWEPIDEPDPKTPQETADPQQVEQPEQADQPPPAPPQPPTAEQPPVAEQPPLVEQPPVVEAEQPPVAEAEQPPETPPRQPEAHPNDLTPQQAALAAALADLDLEDEIAAADEGISTPSVRDELTPDLEEEFAAALGDGSFDALMSGVDAISRQAPLEEESQHTGRVVAVRRDDVFIELGSREQGVVSAKQFEEPPKPGAILDVIVQRYNSDDGLYELSIPHATASVADWSDVHEGMLVEARITGHNTGGLECEVNHLRGFIPVSQIALYRVEDLAQFVDEKFECLITESNPQRRNLVLSRRAVLEREKEEAREKMLESLQPGQIHEGVVRKILDFGAFVDIGGLDGLLHVSQLAWHRVAHPSEVLTEGQTIKVKIEKIDHATGKMSLAYRDMLENPWEQAAKNYPPNSVAKGKVTKIMEFGAFVALEAGVEGLVHISELSHRRVWRTSDVANEGDEVEVLVLSVDPDAQRMSLSIKQLSAPPKSQKKDEQSEVGDLPDKQSQSKKPSKPLQGGLGRSAGGDQFGLKW